MKHFHLYSSNRMERLAAELAAIAARPQANAFARELIVAQSRGMERWLRFELARRNGICAHVDFPFPMTFLRDMFRLLLPDFDDGAEAAFGKSALAWRIMGLLERDDFASRPEIAPLRRYVGDGPRRQTRARQTAEKLSELFDQYLVYRPEMTRGWEAGKMSFGDSADEAWQALMWRELSPEGRGLHREAAREAFAEALERGKERLPERVCVFGISSMPTMLLETFIAISQHIPVHLFLLNPCGREGWFEEAEAGLLGSMGALHREFLGALKERGAPVPGDSLFEETGGGTLLGRIQDGILAGEAAGPAGPFPEEDRSVAIHACHGPLREVEILFDNLLDAFAAIPDLRPRDIVVMTPDIESFASHIHAVFGGRGDERRIPYSVADRGATRESRVADCFLSLLDALDGRFEVSRVSSLLDNPALRERFGLSAAEAEACRRWFDGAAIRWGIDAGPKGPAYPDNTWRAGMDRLLMGYAMRSGGETAFEFPGGDILPFDEIEGETALTLGKLAEFTERLFALAEEASLTPLTPSEWSRLLLRALDDFFVSDDETDNEFQMIRAAAAMEEDAKNGEYEGAVDLDTARSVLRSRLEAEGFGRGFLSGGVTFCSMLPMRSIPFRIICLVGMNEDAFPRATPVSGFDLIQKAPRPGDPSRRKDDRAIFLEALLSARERLYISYSGFNLQTNERVPPSVAVTELMDHIAETAGEPEAVEQIRTEHRLHGFSAGYFRGDRKLFSYSVADCETATAALGAREERFEFFPPGAELPEPEARDTVELSDLTRFFRNPAEFLMQESLGVRYGKDDEGGDDNEAFSVDHLVRYKFLSGITRKYVEAPEETRGYLRAARCSGALPHGTPGDLELEMMSEKSKRLADAVRDVVGGVAPAEVSLSFDVEVPNRGTVRVCGTLGDMFGPRRVVYRSATMKNKDRLKTWIEHLAMCAGAGAEENVSTELVMFDEKNKDEPTTKRFEFVKDAGGKLGGIIGLFFDGLRRPLPFMPSGSFKFFEAAGDGDRDRAFETAMKEWLPKDFGEIKSESEDPYVARCFGEGIPGGDFADRFMEAADRVFNGFPMDK